LNVEEDGVAGILIKNGRLVDPRNGIDEPMDILVSQGEVAAVGRSLYASGAEVIDARGLVVAPGLVDIHCHLRFPGYEEKEDLASGSRAAASGGFTTVVCQPNTKPVLDSVEMIEFVREAAKKQAIVNVLPAAAITVGERGERLTDMEALAAAGVPLFSDDGQPVGDPAVMRDALLRAGPMGRALAVHCEERTITGPGVILEGPVARRLGVPGIPRSAETAMVARDVVLAKETGGRLHVDHVSNALTVDVIRFGKAWGVNLTAEVTALALAFTEETVLSRGADAKLKPPFGSSEDRDALIRGLKDGTIDVIATDHAPHTPYEKSRGLIDAPFGCIGLETALSIVLTVLVAPGVMSLSDAIAKMTVNPAGVLSGVDKGHLSIGADADIVIFDPEAEWVADPERYQSRSRNCPCRGMRLKGRVMYTIVGGKVVVREGAVQL